MSYNTMKKEDFVGAFGAALRLFISQRRKERQGRKGKRKKGFFLERSVKLTGTANIQNSLFFLSFLPFLSLRPLRLCAFARGI